MSDWNQPAVTSAFSMSNQVSAKQPANAHTRARRALSRHANPTANNMTAPT